MLDKCVTYGVGEGCPRHDIREMYGSLLLCVVRSREVLQQVTGVAD